MLVSRRPVAMSLATASVLLAVSTACSSSSDDEDAGADTSEERDGSRDQGEGPEDGASEAEREQQAAPGPEWDTSPASLAAIGDSITRGFDTCGLLQDCPEASWATGTDAEVESLAAQLLGDDAGEDRVWNLAETGAGVAELPEQARQAVRHQPALVTVLIGANDACASDVDSMTDAEAFEADFAEAVDVLRAESPDTQIYVSSVPDLLRLWQEGSESMMARTVWGLASICPSMLADAGNHSDGADARREAVRERVQAYNEALARVCEADALCRYDGGAVFDYEFTSDHLSDWDWFHPGEAGQRELAALAYEQVVAVG